jgi:hypothetical protein
MAKKFCLEHGLLSMEEADKEFRRAAQERAGIARKTGR